MKIWVMMTVDVHFDLGVLHHVGVDNSVGVLELHTARMFVVNFILKMEEVCSPEKSAKLPTFTRRKNTGVEYILTLNHRESLCYKTPNGRTFVSDMSLKRLLIIFQHYVALGHRFNCCNETKSILS
jgi:hypothetical protein